MKWTPTEIETAKAMWTRGLSCSVIGNAIGKSRNAVIGQAHRGGWTQHRQGFARKTPKVKATAEPKFDGRTFNRFRKASEPPELRAKPLPPEPLPPPTCDPATLMDRTSEQCGWILGDTCGPATLMCGAPKDVEATYCGYHASIAYIIPRKPRPDMAHAKRWTHLPSRAVLGNISDAEEVALG